jgi:hypothetical protein
MVSRSVLAFLSGLVVIPLAAQQLRLQPAKPKSNPLDKSMRNAIHSFVTRNTNLPSTAPPKKAPEKKKVLPIRIKPLKLIASNLCSIPLTNVRPAANAKQFNMPKITPPHIDRMPIVEGPAPPCAD